MSVWFVRACRALSLGLLSPAEEKVYSLLNIHCSITRPSLASTNAEGALLQSLDDPLTGCLAAALYHELYGLV